MNWAAKNGHLHAIQFLHANRTEGCTERAMDLAAANNHLEVLQWLNANRTEGCSQDAMDLAVQNGHLEVVKWLHSRGFECGVDAMDIAIRGGHLSIVKFLHEFREESCRRVSIEPTLPVAQGKAIVEWLLVNRCDVNPVDLLYQAVRLNLVDILELLIDRFGVPWSIELAITAAQHCHIDVVRWIFNRNPAWLDQILREEPTKLGFLFIVDSMYDAGLKFPPQLQQSSRYSDSILDWMEDSNRIDKDAVLEILNKPRPRWDRPPF
ncbi:hypothetical protein LEN26_009276 [Aphanomyces euteiches]|nr:hypothetical protein AeMF1_002828 [Aphanomyces euteiches]KAH9127237.1 hypothetical protein LEN26_009276 [Aphanomyces euteiches]KAH9188289.1 hypothetical protein AeNC1_009731 [Aphanomyces euteiches]